jgi:hypothetical protein
MSNGVNMVFQTINTISFSLTTSFVSYAFESFKSFFKDIRFAFINPDDDDGFVTSEPPRRSRHFSYNGDNSATPNSSKLGLPPHQPQQQHDHGKFETILQSGYLSSPKLLSWDNYVLI